MVRRGHFIVFEGADRSGKTTQAKRYADFLCTTKIPLASETPWRFPDRTTQIGKMIDSYLQSETDLDDRTLHLLFSANRWEKHTLLRQTLESGKTVIADRYAYSGVAYSTAKGLPLEWCKNSDDGLPAPDVVVYLDLSPEDSKKRRGYGSERYENLEMQTKVAKTFKALRTPKWKIVDADADEDTVFDRVLAAINQALDESSIADNKINTLW